MRYVPAEKSTSESLAADVSSLSTTTTFRRSQMKREYALNLSILIRAGKETNKDGLSNGE